MSEIALSVEQSQLWSAASTRPRLSGDRSFRLFALRATDGLGRQIAETLDQPLASHEERDFEDGEHKARPLDNVRGTDVYVVQSLHGGPAETANGKLWNRTLHREPCAVTASDHPLRRR
jgi:ribose-phosphate pyrophosphokinase